MKPGSIIVLIIDISKFVPNNLKGKIKNLPIPNTPYVCRDIVQYEGYPEPGVLIEEMVFGSDSKGEFAININAWREIEIPPSIEEEIEECLNRELVAI